MKKWICLLLIVSWLFCAASCTLPFDSPFTLRVSADELSDGYERKATDVGELDDDFRLAMANFSLSLFGKTLTKDEENDLCSPLSAILCLAMIANGADGDTKTQMESAFGMDLDTLNRALYAYTSSLYSADDCKVNIADSIWFRDGNGDLTVNPDFLQTNADWYDAEVYAAPFDSSTVKDINNWCKKETDGMIDKIIDDIGESTVMYLINALCFDAKWAKEYEKSDIHDYTFHNYDGTQTTVDMLYSEEHIYFSAEGVSGFAKNYKGGKYRFVGLLPDENVDVYDYMASLDGQAFLDLLDGGERATVYVKMPEFTYETSMNLNAALKAMGINDMFSASDADFSKLGSVKDGNIFCSEVDQKTFIEVSRNGTKAAAVTWGKMEATCAGPDEILYVTLDRPFVYAIVDTETNLPLFIGAVTTLD